MKNPRRYKTPATSYVTDRHKRVVGLRVLPAMQIDCAEQATRDRFDSLKQPHIDAGVMVMEYKIQILARAMTPAMGAPEIRGRYTSHEVDDLFAAWRQVQDDDMPDGPALERTLLLEMDGDQSIASDGARAAMHCETPIQFYGKSIAELTDGQIAYYAIVRNVYMELKDPKTKDKVISKRWLEHNQAN